MINFSTGNIRKKGNITFKGYAIDIWLKNMKKSEKAFILLLRINLWVYVSFLSLFHDYSLLYKVMI